MKPNALLAAMALVSSMPDRGPLSRLPLGPWPGRSRGNGSRHTFTIGDREVQRRYWRKREMLLSQVCR